MRTAEMSTKQDRSQFTINCSCHVRLVLTNIVTLQLGPLQKQSTGPSSINKCLERSREQ